MVKFKRVMWKNFFATGNAENEIRLDTHPATLIVGKNGGGKSTVAEAICFGLFGRPYRNINKPQVVNSVNNKNCLVEVEFSIGKKHYRVVRGLKPAIFEVYCNDALINKDAASKDYQKVLEDQILKMNFDSFTQIVVLGMASFTPFMQLPAADRREIIEELLDIKIFTTMNAVLKEWISLTKQKLADVDNQISLSKRKAELQVQYIRQLEADRDSRLNELLEKKKHLMQQLRQQKEILGELEKKKQTLTEQTLDRALVASEVGKALKIKRELELRVERLSRDTQFYHEHAICPKCHQGIDEKFKKSIVAENEVMLQKSKSELGSADAEVDKLTEASEAIEQLYNELTDINIKIAKANTQIDSYTTQIAVTKQEYRDIESRVEALENEQQKVKDLAKEALGLMESRAKIVEEQHYHEIASVILKDTGAKTRIIKQYLPAINMLINKYLTIMDFHVQFTLDEKFSEVIKSRHRDVFSYESFSEGEKQRIDLALLFTWRQISKLKQSTNTNLLLLDEVFDSSLDDEGTDHVMALLKELGKDTNVFVISHKGEKLKDKFKHIIKFEKKGNFSVITS